MKGGMLEVLRDPDHPKTCRKSMVTGGGESSAVRGLIRVQGSIPPKTKRKSKVLCTLVILVTA